MQSVILWLSRILLKIAGWRVEVSVPDYPKSIICVAPHTSNIDFVICELAYCSVGRRAGFLMKKSWFRWPLGSIFRAMGGVPVDRSKGNSLTSALVDRFRVEPRLNIAIAPEGTRSRTSRWHTGFLCVATEAGVPVTLAVIDGGSRTVMMNEEFIPSGDIDADMAAIKRYYSQFTAIYPEKFSTETE